MSILLTAGKKSVQKKPKSAKGRKKSTSQQAFNPTPPISSAKTAVWHWILDGIPTTVMLNKESSEVWCNGVVLDTIDGFVEDDGDAGGVVDFCIYIEETQSTHKARIKRSLSGDSRYGIAYDLFVDGYQIDEHLGNGQQYQEQYTEQYQGYDQSQVYDQSQAYAGGYDGYENYDQNGYAGYDQYQEGAGALPNYGDPIAEAPPSYEQALVEDKKTK